MAEPNFSLLSDKDLLAIEQDRWEDVSDAALTYLEGKEIGAWDAFTSNASRSIQSSLQNIAGWMGAEDNPETEQILQQKESEARIATETNPVAGILGQVVGAIADPITLPALVLKPLTIAGSALKTGALRGVVAGTFGGAINPVFEEFGDSRLANIATGATLGGAIGTGAAALLKKYGIDISGDPQSPEYAEKLKEEILALPNDRKDQLLLEWNGQLEAEKPKLLSFDGTVTRAEDDAFEIPTKRTEWNPELKSLETVEEVADELPTLPPQVKKAVKINKVDAEFSNDIDHALWVAGENKGVSSRAAMSWLTEKTGLGQREVQGIANKARMELAKRVGTMTPDNGKLRFDRPSMLAGMLKQRIAPTRVIRTAVQPKRIDVKDGLDPNDIEKLKLTGVVISQDGKGGVQFRDALNGNKFMSASTLKERMNAVGIDLNVPGYREKIRATQNIPQEEVAKIADEAPVIKEAEATAEAQNVSRTTGGEKVRIPKREDVLDIPPEDIGIPKQQRSVGSAGVDPKAYLTPELMPKTMKDINKGGDTRERVLMKMLENDDPRVAIPKDMDKTVRGKGSFAALKQAGAKALREIIDEYGNIAEFMLAKKGLKDNMSADQVVGFRWFYADAMANRDKVLTRVKDLVDSGESLDTQEAAELARDLVYYTGIDLFYKNDGTKASRAMNARRIIAQTISSGQTPQTKMMRGIFPGMGCQ
jgi:hypothetical protein